MAKRYPDGSYNPMWPWEEDEPAAFLVIGSKGGGGVAYNFENIRMRCENTMWIAEADNSGTTWTGTSENFYGAILAMLAERCGLQAEISYKPEPDEEDDARCLSR